MAAESDRDEPKNEAGADELASTAAEPPKKKKKKGSKTKKGAAAREPVPLPGAGTPDGDKLREAMRAFEVGDYARVRARTRELASASDPKVREAAADLAERIAIDPVQVVVILACAAVLATIVYVWVL
ncbi:MAG TPA: hypothetical protein VIL20_24840 [Sandaracinaceae bacterium]